MSTLAQFSHGLLAILLLLSHGLQDGARAQGQLSLSGGPRLPGRPVSPPGVGGFSMHDRCEPITIPMCGDIAYNDTIFPNLMGHVNQEQAGQDMSTYVPLINIKCSPDILLFLCAMYAPVCTILDYAIPPCRALCLSAKTGCEDLMLQFDFRWPKEFDCDKFPVGGKPDEVRKNNITLFLHLSTNYFTLSFVWAMAITPDFPTPIWSTSRHPRPGRREGRENSTI